MLWRRVPMGRGEVVRVPEVLEPDEVWAHPVERESRQPEYIVVRAAQLPSVEQHAAPWVEPSGYRWDRLACYVAGLAMLALVIGLLIAAGAIDLHALRPPWLEAKP
jgi:hypothetical protein